LAADIGERLGCGAHLAALRRTAIGPLAVSQAHTLAALELLEADARDERLQPVDFLLADLDAARLQANVAASFVPGAVRGLVWDGRDGESAPMTTRAAFSGFAVRQAMIGSCRCGCLREHKRRSQGMSQCLDHRDIGPL
jgi:tRNA U55 pseudouridine synthase TruB